MSALVGSYDNAIKQTNQNGINAILNADYIIIGPGDLYTSLIPNFVVDDMKQALSKSRATIINIMNLMTKRGQTPKYTATDHITDIERYIGRKINTILINNTPMSQEIISYYKRRQEIPVVDDLTNGRSIIRQDLLDEDLHDKEKSDLAIRSLVRHSSVKIGSAIMEIIG